MAALIWTEPALQDIDAIADYIALDNPLAARELVQRVFQHVEQLQAHPERFPSAGTSSVLAPLPANRGTALSSFLPL